MLTTSCFRWIWSFVFQWVRIWWPIHGVVPSGMRFHRLSWFRSPRSSRWGPWSIWISLAPWSWVASASPPLSWSPFSWPALAFLWVLCPRLLEAVLSAYFSRRAAWWKLVLQGFCWMTLLSFISSLSFRPCCAIDMVGLLSTCPCLPDFILAESKSNHPVPVPIFRFRRLLAQCVFGCCHGTS